MTKPLKASPNTTHRALFLRKKLCFTPKNAKKHSKTPSAVDYRGIFDQKKYAVKEPDHETGLYYYGARYLDPKTSRWISGDPALGEYLPVAPLGDRARKRNRNLPGQGGIFNYVNLHVYHYARNNPVKYIDPTGRENIDPDNDTEQILPFPGFPQIPQIPLTPPSELPPIDITPPDKWHYDEDNMPIFTPGKIFPMPIWPLYEEVQFEGEAERNSRISINPDGW